MPDGRRVIIPYWRSPTLRVPWRKVGTVMLGVLIVVGLVILRRIVACR